MIGDLETTVKLCARAEITFNQAALLWLSYSAKYPLVYQYTEEAGGWSEEEIEDLTNKGFLENHNRNGESYVDNYYVTDQFLELLLNVNPEQRCEEFWDAYPSFLQMDGKRIPTKGTGKEAFVRSYTMKHGRFIDKHKRIMAALDYGKRTGMITMGIQKFVESEQWDEIEKERKKLEDGSGLPTQNVYNGQ